MRDVNWVAEKYFFIKKKIHSSSIIAYKAIKFNVWEGWKSCVPLFPKKMNFFWCMMYMLGVMPILLLLLLLSKKGEILRQKFDLRGVECILRN